jgi:hypothetical protein
MISFPDLTESGEDAYLLTRFYDTLYVREFPDPATRHSLAELLGALRRKSTGELGRDNRHVVLALLDGQVVGGASAVFLAEPNVAVLEFVVGADEESFRRLLARTEDLLKTDAERLGRPLSAILAELTEPQPGYRRLAPSATVRAVLRVRTVADQPIRSSTVDLVEFGG